MTNQFRILLLRLTATIAAMLAGGCNMPSVTPQPVTPPQPTAHTITIKVEDGKIALVGGADVTVKSAAAESVPVVNDPLPEVWAYSMPECDHCKRAKSEFAAATDLPFVVRWKTDPPWWLESAAKPAFWFHVSRDQPSQDDVNNTRQTSGWPGLPEFRAKWTANRQSARTNASAAASRPFAQPDRSSIGSRSVAIWSINGDFTPSRSTLLSHLTHDGIHRGYHDRAMLESLTTEQLRWLHDRDHQSR